MVFVQQASDHMLRYYPPIQHEDGLETSILGLEFEVTPATFSSPNSRKNRYDINNEAERLNHDRNQVKDIYTENTHITVLLTCFTVNGWDLTKPVNLVFEHKQSSWIQTSKQVTHFVIHPLIKWMSIFMFTYLMITGPTLSKHLGTGIYSSKTWHNLWKLVKILAHFVFLKSLHFELLHSLWQTIKSIGPWKKTNHWVFKNIVT